MRHFLNNSPSKADALNERRPTFLVEIVKQTNS